MPRHRQGPYNGTGADSQALSAAVAELAHDMEMAVVHEVLYPEQIRRRLAAVRKYIERTELEAWTRPTRSLDWIDVFVLRPIEAEIRQEARLRARLTGWAHGRDGR
jgi:hypothetical protein